MMTYDRMKKLVEGKLDESHVPTMVIFDESSKLKGGSAQRTKSAIKLGEIMREVHGDENCHIILLSGRPAPNTPVDWWAQCETACPGFLREGKYPIFEDRLCLKVKVEKMDGDKTFQKIVTWWDDTKKCRTCGITKDDHPKDTHVWVPSVNEVAKLERRLKGLVLTIFKKDCLDLPEKNYLKLSVKPNPRAKMLALQIRRESESTGDTMYRLRALSDGYLVKDVKSKDTQPCSGCDGSGQLSDIGLGEGVTVPCAVCEGGGVLHKYHREFVPISSPKMGAFNEVLENYYDLGRLVVWASLHGTLELLRKAAVKGGWNIVQFDGKQVKFHNTMGIENPPKTQEEMLLFFQEDKKYPTVFIGNPEAAGMGLTLTAADAMVFYSNSWKPEARQQGEDRIHRPGSTGAKIIDIVCMPIDEVIREALMNKEKLQDLSLGKLNERLDRLDEVWEETPSPAPAQV